MQSSAADNWAMCCISFLSAGNEESLKIYITTKLDITSSYPSPRISTKFLKDRLRDNDSIKTFNIHVYALESL